QLIKDIGRGIKKDAEYRIEQKTRQAVKKGIDTLEKKAKNKKGKKETEEETIENKPFSQKEESETKGDEGFIILHLSTPVTTKGLPVFIRGASIKYGKWNTIKIRIKGPEDEEEVTVALSDSGKYSLIYDKLLEEGDYIFTATSSDGKAEASERLKVNDIYQPEDETKDLMDATGAAFERLKNRASRLKGMISNKDDATLQKKISEVKEKLDALHTCLNDLRNTKKEIGDLYKAGKVPSKNIRQNLAVLNQMIASKTEEVKKIKAIGEHEPFDNSVCEYIAMVNEACAAFSTITAFFAKSVGGVIKNIIIDKAVPFVTEKGLDLTASDKIYKGKTAGDEVTWGAKEASKIYALSLFDMEGLTGKLGKAELAGDLIQFATDVLMKTHCGVFKGAVTHHYKFGSKNANGKNWWEYTVISKAAITLRYPKSNSGIINMKGTIEGNATKFEFYADPTQNSEYVQGTAGKVQTTMLKSYNPYTLPFATSLHGELGFGMATRAALTPAYFLIPVDAEYNTQTGKIKIFINEALMDFWPETIFNSQIFIQWSAGLPKLRRMDYPIAKARRTINAALKDNNEFDIKKDPKGNLSFSETAKRHIDGDENEHLLEVTISAKKE
ncbi:MAG TPA: hypothetical protein VI461_15140, partial [Chitinophagaceae bacterium]|nr:hypothetical protein [Chitinophagaceae bacterium]